MKAKGKKADKKKASPVVTDNVVTKLETKTAIEVTTEAAPIEVEVSGLIEVLPEFIAAKPEQKPEIRPEVAPTISSDERRRLISLAAYYRAEHKGFGKTNPVEDWLLAEREVDAMISRGATL